MLVVVSWVAVPALDRTGDPPVVRMAATVRAGESCAPFSRIRTHRRHLASASASESMREARTPRIEERQDGQPCPVSVARTRQHDAVGSLHDLACAAQHLRHYTAPGSGRAFHVYDRAGQPDILEPVDALAPALLDAPVRASWS